MKRVIVMSPLGTIEYISAEWFESNILPFGWYFVGYENIGS